MNRAIRAGVAASAAVAVAMLVADGGPIPVAATAPSDGPAARIGGAAPVAPLPARAQLPAQDTGTTYRLVDTWSGVPWSLVPGRYGRVADISSAPDGTTFVLDTRHSVVHVISAAGEPRGIVRLPDTSPLDGWTAQRLDAGFDGTFYVLSLGPYEMTSIRPQRIDRFAPDGRHLARIALDVPDRSSYVDLAIHPDGRIYVVRIGPQNPFLIWPGPTPTPLPPDAPGDSGVDVLSPDGALVAIIAPPEMDIPFGVDVDGAGAVYVINRVPVPWYEPPPGATPTPRPSWQQGPEQAATPRPPAPVEGIMYFAPDHRYLRTWAFAGAEDLAVGPAGLFVSRQVDIYKAEETEPLYTGPFGRVYAALFDEVVFHLDVPADGRLLAGMYHCYYQGILDFGAPTQRPARPILRGSLDRPELEGPVYPMRLASSGGQLVALQGRYTIDGLRPDQEYYAAPYAEEPQTAQRWQTSGELQSQLGLCSSSESWWVRDIAMDGADVYTADANLVQRRPNDGFPAWSYLPSVTLPITEPSRIAALSADGGRLAVLDAAAGRVSVLDRNGQPAAEWRASTDPRSVLVDLALNGSKLAIADAGTNQVLLRSLDGADLGAWPIHDGPLGIDVGADGGIFVIGRGGWAYRYDPDGRRTAAWPMPERGLDGLDIACGDDGRVYIAFIGRDRLNLEQHSPYDPQFRIQPAGVWVFEPATLPEPPDVPVAGCRAYPDKSADPPRIPLGDQVDVALSVEGDCPGSYEPAQLMFVIDTSRSMNWYNALERAKDAAIATIDALSGRPVQIGVVTFDDGPALREPLTGDLAAVQSRIAGLTAWGDTQLANAIDVARLELVGEHRDPNARQAIILFTDGVIKDQPEPAAQVARDAGIEIDALLFPTMEYLPDDVDRMAVLTDSYERVVVDPDDGWIGQLADDLVAYHTEPGLFATIEIQDLVPANMRYIVGSAVPVARWDPVERALTWHMDDVAAVDGIRLQYRLEPLEAGTWPTNVTATGAYTDALRQQGRLVFPVPQVEVYEPSSAIYLPMVQRQVCVPTAQPLDIVLVLDTSTSMDEPAPGGLTKLQAATLAAGTFIGLLRQDIDRIAVVGFNDRADRASGLTGDGAAARAALASLTTRQGTAIDLGLAEADTILQAEARSDAVRVAVLLSDGIQTRPGDPVAEADQLKAHAAVVYAIGLGDGIDLDRLTRIASSADHLLLAPTADQLEAVFRELAVRLDCDRAATVYGRSGGDHAR